MNTGERRIRRPLRAIQLLAVVLLGLGASSVSFAEPYLALRMGLKCNACHVNPTGGGMRNDFGTVFAQQVLPANPGKDAPIFSGKISDLLRVGADVRTNWSNSDIPHQKNEHGFELNLARIYGYVQLLPDKLALYVDQQVAPGTSVTQEAYVRYGNTNDGWYLKGGKFYLPFGWRLQDNTAFVRLNTAISMAAPDTGFEIGFEKSRWSAQLAVSDGLKNAGEKSGYQAIAQLVWVASPLMRFGVAGGRTNSDNGDRSMGGLFAGFHTGPLVWLAETDLVRDEGFADGAHSGVSALAEVDWNFRPGQNLKLTGEYLDPDKDTGGNSQNRMSLVYELTPLPFVQLRVGYRRFDGIETIDQQNRQLTFIELHGFF